MASELKANFNSTDGLEEDEKDDILQFSANIQQTMKTIKTKRIRGRPIDQETDKLDQEARQLSSLVVNWAQRPKPTLSLNPLSFDFTADGRKLLRELYHLVQSGIIDHRDDDTFAKEVAEKTAKLVDELKRDTVDFVEADEMWAPEDTNDPMDLDNISISPPPELADLPADTQIKVEDEEDGIPKLEDYEWASGEPVYNASEQPQYSRTMGTLEQGFGGMKMKEEK